MSDIQIRAPGKNTFNLNINNLDGSLICYYVGEEPGWHVASFLKSPVIKINIENLSYFDSLQISSNSNNLTTILTQEQYNSGITEVTIAEDYLLTSKIYFKTNGLAVEVPVDIKIKVQITCDTPEASIYYTTDNTDPDETKNLYTDIFEVSNYTTVKAIGIKEGYINSEVSQKDIFY